MTVEKKGVRFMRVIGGFQSRIMVLTEYDFQVKSNRFSRVHINSEEFH